MGALTLTNEGRTALNTALAASQSITVTKVIFGQGAAADPLQVTGVETPFSPGREIGTNLLVVEQQGTNITLLFGPVPSTEPAYTAREALIIGEYPAGTEVAFLYESIGVGQTVFQNFTGQENYYRAFYTVRNADASLFTGTIVFASGATLPATPTRAGVVELATQDETNAGRDANRVITPQTLSNYSGLGVVDGGITEAKLADQAVTVRKLKRDTFGGFPVDIIKAGAVLPAAVSLSTPVVLNSAAIDSTGMLEAGDGASAQGVPVLFVDPANIPTGAGALGADAAVDATGIIGPTFLQGLRLHSAGAAPALQFAVNDTFYFKVNWQDESTDPFQKAPTQYPAGKVVSVPNPNDGTYGVLYSPLVRAAAGNAKRFTTAGAFATTADWQGATGVRIIAVGGQGGEGGGGGGGGFFDALGSSTEYTNGSKGQDGSQGGTTSISLGGVTAVGGAPGEGGFGGIRSTPDLPSRNTQAESGRTCLVGQTGGAGGNGGRGRQGRNAQQGGNGGAGATGLVTVRDVTAGFGTAITGVVGAGGAGGAGGTKGTDDSTHPPPTASMDGQAGDQGAAGQVILIPIYPG